MTGYERAQAGFAKVIGEFVDAGLERFGSVEAFHAALEAANAERRTA